MYATLNTPIKHWSSEMLYKLQDDMFSKASVGDASGDDKDSIEETHSEGNMLLIFN